MIRNPIKLFVFSCAALLSLNAEAQNLNWPKPASTPNTTVKCDAAIYKGCENADGKFIAGWDLPIKAYTGRVIDSTGVFPVQYGFRTARGYMFKVTPTRIYENTGSTVLSWNRSTFFSRLPTEPLTPGTAFPAGRNGAPEYLLRWDGYFCAEGFSNWQTPVADGDQRLFDIDYDDRGFVYVAYSIFGWGITKDNGSGSFDSGNQRTPISNAQTIFSVKGSDNRYYAVVSDPGPAEVWTAGQGNGLGSLQKVASIPGTIHRWAKSADGTRVAIVTDDGLKIYSNDGIIAGGAPLISANAPDCGGLPCGNITSVDSDGTNFFARYDKFFTRNGVIVMKAAGGTYTQTNYDLGIVPAQGAARPNIRFGAGLLALSGGEITPALGGGRSFYNVRLYKMNDLVPTEIKARDNTTFRFFAQYYSANSGLDGYGAYNSAVNDAVPVQEGNKTYLIVAAFALADVFELQTSDSITASIVSTRGTANPNSANISGSGPFVGDQITFRSETSTGSQPQVNWDFGDGKVGATVPNVNNISHQYTAAGTFNAQATNALDIAMKSIAPVTVKAPVVAIGVLGRADLLFKLPNASSTAAILTSDAFIDASDGGVESHYNDWIFTGGSTTQLTPSQTTAVGGCGPHTLVFAAHYGPYITGTFGAATPTGGTAINGLTYVARPYVAAITGPSAGASGRVRFTSAPRLTTTAADLPGGTATPVKYTWVASNGETSTGNATLGTVPFFDVTKPAAGSLSVDLTLEVTSVLPAPCAVLAVHKAQTLGPLAAPVATLQKNGCTVTGATCGFSVVTTANTAGWTYAWTVTPSINIVPNGATATISGMQGNVNYTVNVTIDNTIGALPLSNTFLVTAPNCPPMTVSNVGITYFGAAGGSFCRSGNTCDAGENIRFNATAFGYSFSCAPHSFTWNFGDNTPAVTVATADGPTHAYSGSGTYTVTMTVDNGNQTPAFSTTAAVQIGTVSPPPPPPPTPTGCGTMTTSNVGLGYFGTQTGSFCAPTQQCSTGENIQFSTTQFAGYQFTCANHTFNWDFGDGTSTSTQGTSGTTTHSYATNGTFTTTVTISNGTQSNFQTSVKVQVGPAAPVNPCNTMSASNVFVNYSGPKSNCTTGGNCNTSDNLDFFPSAGGGGLAGSTAYSFTCNAHTFAWDFGDGTTTTSSDPNAHVKHTYGSAGNYTLRLTINNGKQSYTVTQVVKVTQAVAVLPAPCAPTQICVNNLGNARFSVSLSANGPNGPVAGTAVTQQGQFGFFSFPQLTGDATNPEVMVKVMQLGTGRPWVFYAGLTNLSYGITVHDSQGLFSDKVYPVAAPGAGSMMSIGDYDVDGNKSPSCLPTETAFATAAPGTCTADTNTLCLLDRFKVTLQVQDNPTRSTNSGAGAALATSKVFGMFSTPTLSDATDIQAFVKMVDARSLDGHFWVFLGGLTDMRLTFTVTDTLTGARNIYTKPFVSTCGWNDVNAFR